MKYYELDNNEKKILKDFENGKFSRVSRSKKNQEQYRQYAQTTLDKTKNINLRIAEKDLLKIKAHAAEKGIPYQTLLASLIHQYTSGQTQDRV